MGHGSYTIAEIEKMLIACTKAKAEGKAEAKPEARIVLRGHHYRAIRGELMYTQLPKGKGPKGQPMNKVIAQHDQIRSLVRILNVDQECANRHLPLAWS